MFEAHLLKRIVNRTLSIAKAGRAEMIGTDNQGSHITTSSLSLRQTSSGSARTMYMSTSEESYDPQDLRWFRAACSHAQAGGPYALAIKHEERI